MDRLWTRLEELPLVIESVEYERRTAAMSAGFQRITTVLHLRGGGEEGLGEDVSIHEDESGALHTRGAGAVPVAGEWTFGSFCAHLAGTDQWAEEPEYPPARRWRNWGFESAALDLALRQAGKALHEVLGRESAPLTFVNSLGLGEEPSFDPIARRLEKHPELRFKIDAHPLWSPELIARLADTGAVDIVDFKGRYGMEVEDPEALGVLYDRVIEAFPDALLEDAHDLPEITERLKAHEHRISYDAPIATPADLDAQPLRPRAVNIKPCRVGLGGPPLRLEEPVGGRGGDV
jgi:hypothetical protein